MYELVPFTDSALPFTPTREPCSASSGTAPAVNAVYLALCREDYCSERLRLQLPDHATCLASPKRQRCIRANGVGRSAQASRRLTRR